MLGTLGLKLSRFVVRRSADHQVDSTKRGIQASERVCVFNCHHSLVTGLTMSRFDYLSAHLVTVSNQGSTAFLLARRNMARIGQNSKDIKYPVSSEISAREIP